MLSSDGDRNTTNQHSTACRSCDHHLNSKVDPQPPPKTGWPSVHLRPDSLISLTTAAAGSQYDCTGSEWQTLVSLHSFIRPTSQLRAPLSFGVVACVDCGLPPQRQPQAHTAHTVRSSSSSICCLCFGVSEGWSVLVCWEPAWAAHTVTGHMQCLYWLDARAWQASMQTARW